MELLSKGGSEMEMRLRAEMEAARKKYEEIIKK